LLSTYWWITLRNTAGATDVAHQRVAEEHNAKEGNTLLPSFALFCSTAGVEQMPLSEMDEKCADELRPHINWD
jgi:hypothetical protein